MHPADGSETDEGYLAEDVARLVHAWSADAVVGRLAPRLLSRAESRPVFLPATAVDDSTESCTTVAVLGTRNVGFLLAFPPQPTNPSRRTWPIPSSAGAAEVTRCGARKSLLRGLTVQMRSPRGVLEYVVAVSKDPPPPLTEVLPTRDPGPSLPSPSVGPRPAQASPSERLRAIEQRARREGAHSFGEASTVADATGRGAEVLHLVTGCHRFDVLAAPGSDGPVDIDARLSSLARDEEFVSDESSTGQAILRWCVGRPGRVRLAFAGASPASEVTIAHTTWTLPETLPVQWGPVARGRLAMALGPHLSAALTDSAIYSSLGVQGGTQLPFEVEPGACYAVALSTIRGKAQNLALGVRSGSVFRENHARGEPGVAVSFCNNRATTALVEVQATGSGLAWLLGVWPSSRRDLGAGTE